MTKPWRHEKCKGLIPSPPSALLYPDKMASKAQKGPESPQ